MPELDEKIYEHIKTVTGKHYLGRTLREIEGRFARGATSSQEVWTALSRLTVSKRIKKSGSHRYKGYVVTDQPSRESEAL